MNCAVHNQTQAVAYCRTCGKALCEECKRDVMGAIYCEPCIAARLQGAPGVSVPGTTIVPPPQAPPGAPNPVIAGLLGFIPGVGAMYNGQFTKAFAHVVIFVLLIVGASNASGDIAGIFGGLIAFFVFYMAFEAYKTAEAKRHGLPGPDPLGLDKLFGIQESQQIHSTSVPSVGNAAAYPPVTPQAQQPLQVEPPPAPPQDNAPIGAIVLIALGVIFLLQNLGIFHAHSLWPLLLIGVGLWIVYKRTIQPGVGGSR